MKESVRLYKKMGGRWKCGWYAKLILNEQNKAFVLKGIKGCKMQKNKC